MNEIPLSLYVHFPWCIKKCPYCDFNSYEQNDNNSEGEYLLQLEKDLIEEKSLLNRQASIHSIFIGGGTPSLISPETIAQLLLIVGRLFPLDPAIEITLEANPGTTDKEKFNGYFDAGVNRLSIGVQSFNDKHLAQLGRIHHADDAIQAFTTAREAGFDNINLDLMHGLPGQTCDEAMQDLELALSLGSEHLSWYQLTIERNTYFYKYPPLLPHEDLLWNITEAGLAMLSLKHYARYEVSAFAREGKQCRHNINYWRFGDYLGIGAGAHGKITSRTNPFSIQRTTRTRSPADYLVAANRQSLTVDAESIVLEFLMNALRLTEGFSQSIFESRTGLSFNQLDSFLDKGLRQKLIHLSSESALAGTSPVNENHVYPTELGTRYLDELLLLTD